MSFYLPAKEKAALKEFAEFNELSYTDVIRLALKHYTNRNFKPGICPTCGAIKGEEKDE